MPIRATRRWVLPCLLLCASPAGAQDGDRIWGRVLTDAGDVLEGFVRWDRNEGSWVDILDGTKGIPEETYRMWLAEWEDGEQPVRTIELKGYRISWNEDDPDFPSSVSSGIRFGHIQRLEVVERDRVELTLRSGRRLELSGGATDLGPSMRELLVEVPGRDPVELDWSELRQIDFSAAPSGTRAPSPRLFGTVEDQSGRRFTGYVSWDLDEIFEADVLDGSERDLEFRAIRSIEWMPGGARVTLRSGDEVELTGTSDVGRGNRGVQVSDPALGMVEVERSEFVGLRLHEAPEVVGYDHFDGGHPLMGTVVTRSGESIRGRIRWDADEEWSWELLDGRSDDVSFAIEFSHIARIQRDSFSGASVTLHDGRTFELDDSNDVDENNRGIFVLPAAEPAPPDSAAPPDSTASPAATPGEWRLITWDEFQEVVFADPSGSGGEVRP